MERFPVPVFNVPIAPSHSYGVPGTTIQTGFHQTPPPQQQAMPYNIHPQVAMANPMMQFSPYMQQSVGQQEFMHPMQQPMYSQLHPQNPYNVFPVHHPHPHQTHVMLQHHAPPMAGTQSFPKFYDSRLLGQKPSMANATPQFPQPRQWSTQNPHAMLVTQQTLDGTDGVTVMHNHNHSHNHSHSHNHNHNYDHQLYPQHHQALFTNMNSPNNAPVLNSSNKLMQPYLPSHLVSPEFAQASQQQRPDVDIKPKIRTGTPATVNTHQRQRPRPDSALDGSPSADSRSCSSDGSSPSEGSSASNSEVDDVDDVEDGSDVSVEEETNTNRKSNGATRSEFTDNAPPKSKPIRGRPPQSKRRRITQVHEPFKLDKNKMNDTSRGTAVEETSAQEIDSALISNTPPPKKPKAKLPKVRVHAERYGYRGISKYGTKWKASVTANGHRHYMWGFKTAHDAAKAYNLMALSLLGSRAGINILRENANESAGVVLPGSLGSSSSSSSSTTTTTTTTATATTVGTATSDVAKLLPLSSSPGGTVSAYKHMVIPGKGCFQVYVTTKSRRGAVHLGSYSTKAEANTAAAKKIAQLNTNHMLNPTLEPKLEDNTEPVPVPAPFKRTYVCHVCKSEAPPSSTTSTIEITPTSGKTKKATTTTTPTTTPTTNTKPKSKSKTKTTNKAKPKTKTKTRTNMNTPAETEANASPANHAHAHAHAHDMLACVRCRREFHQKCLEYPTVLWQTCIAMKSPWTCADCKICVVCAEDYTFHPDDEPQMLLCDKCDTGIHMGCAGLKKLPSSFSCELCKAKNSKHHGKVAGSKRKDGTSAPRTAAINESIAQCYVGRRVRVWWNETEVYEGTIIKLVADPEKPVRVLYDDGEELEESFDSIIWMSRAGHDKSGKYRKNKPSDAGIGHTYVDKRVKVKWNSTETYDAIVKGFNKSSSKPFVVLYEDGVELEEPFNTIVWMEGNDAFNGNNVMQTTKKLDKRSAHFEQAIKYEDDNDDNNNNDDDDDDDDAISKDDDHDYDYVDDNDDDDDDDVDDDVNANSEDNNDDDADADSESGSE